MIIDIQNNGIGDVVLACWILNSTDEKGVFLNPRNNHILPSLFNIPEDRISSETSINWSESEGAGHLYEYKNINSAKYSRFELWMDCLGLKSVPPKKPTFSEAGNKKDWANKEWGKVDPSSEKKRVIIFPDAAYRIRTWPIAYYRDVVKYFLEEGWAVVAMSDKAENLQKLDCHWWYGFPLENVASMINQSNLVICNDSGPAHLAGAIGVETIAICGPTQGQRIYAHDDMIKTACITEEHVPCVGCHFSNSEGYNPKCVNGCVGLTKYTASMFIGEIEQSIKKYKAK